MKFSIKDFLSKCDQIRSFLQIWSHLLKNFLMENFIFCTVPYFKKGFIFAIIGGGITGDIQINSTSCHHHLREFEMKTMLEQLKKDPNKIPFLHGMR